MMNGGAEDSIVSEWLRSLGLQQYSSAFYDNGYDDLELCKQIKEEDLDAICVTHPLHRKIILDSALILRSEGATSVYFTLEDAMMRQRGGSAKPMTFQNPAAPVDGNATRELIYDVSPNPKHHMQSANQLSNYRTSAGLTQNNNVAQNPPDIRGGNYQSSNPSTLWESIARQLARENVDITSSPYTQSGNVCVAIVTALAMRYAEQLSCDYFQVMSVLENMIKRKLYDSQVPVAPHYAAQVDPRLQHFQEAGSSGSSREKCEMFLGHRTPPAVPSCPPPSQQSAQQTQKERDLTAVSDTARKSHPPPYQRSQSACSRLGHSTRTFQQSDQSFGGYPMEQHTCGRAKYYPGDHLHSNILGQPGIGYSCTCPHQPGMAHNQSTITHNHNQSTITHNHNQSTLTQHNQSALNQQCKQCKDLQCKEVAIFEQKRLEALMHVKAGKIGIDEGMARIKLYEKQRSACCEKKNKKKSTTAKIGEFFKLPSFRRKNKQDKCNPSKSTRSLSCSETGCNGISGQLGSSISTNQLASDLAAKCTCGLQFSIPHSRSMTLTTPPQPLCSCEECLRLRGGAYHMQTPPSPMLGHRSGGGGVRSSARYPSANRRLPIGADIVRAPPTCRQCHTPLNHPQKPLPKFYSPQVTRKTYQPLTSPTPHHYIKPFSEKFDAWYQRNLPSDDETRNLIDPNQSDTDSSMNLSFDAFGLNSRAANRSIVSPSLLKGSMPQNVRTLTPQPVSGGPPQAAVGLGNTASDLGNSSYQSDSLSSDDLAQRSAQHNTLIKQQAGSDASPTVVRGRRDSGCYLSNENINNNSSNSSTSEKANQKLTISTKTAAGDNAAGSSEDSGTVAAASSSTELAINKSSTEANIDSKTITRTAEPAGDTYSESQILERMRRQMHTEGIDLTAHPYTDKEGQWCVPISLVSRYAQLCGLDLTTTALAMDAARCSELERTGRKWVALSADNTSRNPEQKRIASVGDFLVLSGLPMYTDVLLRSGCDTLADLASMNEEKLKQCGISDPLHIEIIVSAINSTWSAKKSETVAPAVSSTPTDSSALTSTTLVHQV